MQIGHKSSATTYTGIMLLNNVSIDWVNNFKYRGVAFITGQEVLC